MQSPPSPVRGVQSLTVHSQCSILYSKYFLNQVLREDRENGTLQRPSSMNAKVFLKVLTLAKLSAFSITYTTLDSIYIAGSTITLI